MQIKIEGAGMLQAALEGAKGRITEAVTEARRVECERMRQDAVTLMAEQSLLYHLSKAQDRHLI